MYLQNHYPVFLILEMCDRRSLQQAYSFQKHKEFYINTMRYESMKVQGVEKFEGIVVIFVAGLHFLQEYLSAPDHCIPKADAIFDILWKKHLFTEVEFLFMCSSWDGIRPHSRKYCTSWESCSCLLQTPEAHKVQTVFVSSIYQTLPKLKQTSEAAGDLGSLWQMSEKEKLTCVCAFMHIFVQIDKHTALH